MKKTPNTKVMQKASDLALKLLRLFEKNNSKVISEKSRTIWKNIFSNAREKLTNPTTFESILKVDNNFRKNIAKIVRQEMISVCSKQVEILEDKKRTIKGKIEQGSNDKNGSYHYLIGRLNKIERDKKLYCNSKDEWHAFNLALTSFCIE